MLPPQSLASSISDFTPVSHWTCDEEGGVRYDSVTASGNDLTDNNTVGFDTGLLGNACVFNSTNSEYLSITDASQSGLETGGSFSISLWVNYTILPSSGNDKPLFSKWTSSGWMFYSRISGGTQYLSVGINSAVNVSIPWTPSTYTDYHLVVTYDSSDGSVSIYSNNILLGTGTASTNNPDNSNLVGIGMYENGAALFDGTIEEITFFDYVLDSTQVTTLYNSGTPLAYSGGTPPVDPPATTTPTTTPTTSDNGDLVFILSVIVFFLSTFWVGYIISMFRKTA